MGLLTPADSQPRLHVQFSLELPSLQPGPTQPSAHLSCPSPVQGSLGQSQAGRQVPAGRESSLLATRKNCTQGQQALVSEGWVTSEHPLLTQRCWASLTTPLYPRTLCILISLIHLKRTFSGHLQTQDSTDLLSSLCSSKQAAVATKG